MKNIKNLILLAFIALSALTSLFAQPANYADTLSKIDPEILKYFPRWRVCEPDLQFQVYKVFDLLGFPKKDLNMQMIEVVAAPRSLKSKFYDILLVSCGTQSMNSKQMESEMKRISEVLAGKREFIDDRATYDLTKKGERNYCFADIEPDIPVSSTQAKAILSYFEPTDVDQSISISLFEQSIKLGETGFWIKNKVGSDEVGYPFWTSGESKLSITRPLYVNNDPTSNTLIANLINFNLGVAYRITSGIESNSLFNWIPNRTLNGGPNGKLVSGFDFHLPSEPRFGLHVNVEVPITDIKNESVKVSTYGLHPFNRIDPDGRDRLDQANDTVKNGAFFGTAPVMRSTGQATLFYHLWIDEKENPENYFRFDLGVSYSDVREYLYYGTPNVYNDKNTGYKYFLTNQGVAGLNTYKNNEFGDWVYAKVEYRSQATYPFSIGLQYSNQTLLAKTYIPLFGKWLFLEAKYSTQLRGIRPYEIGNFFIISPVLRITI
ncbi:MAG: hypothetical protein NTW25_09330 [Candidatus Kapabacteria bacterium]|nr:hypothetical protein [Candidatus Kapabacteria bacterium]